MKESRVKTSCSGEFANLAYTQKGRVKMQLWSPKTVGYPLFGMHILVVPLWRSTHLNLCGHHIFFPNVAQRLLYMLYKCKPPCSGSSLQQPWIASGLWPFFHCVRFVIL